MHKHVINASLQIIPIVPDNGAYKWIDEVIELIQQSGISYEVGPFATILEGTYDDVFKVIHAVNDYLEVMHCTEWIMNAQVQIKPDMNITTAEKVAKFKV